MPPFDSRTTHVANHRRDRLIHEYAEDPERFAEAIATACRNVEILVTTYNRLRNYAIEHMGTSNNSSFQA